VPPDSGGRMPVVLVMIVAAFITKGFIGKKKRRDK